jgi:hypothetical protein
MLQNFEKVNVTMSNKIFYTQLFFSKTNNNKSHQNVKQILEYFILMHLVESNNLKLRYNSRILTKDV